MIYDGELYIEFWNGKDIDSRTVYIRNNYRNFEKNVLNTKLYPPIPIYFIIISTLILLAVSLLYRCKKNIYLF